MARSEQPNILFIMTDQQRGDCLGADGHPFLLTPTMDSIAASGMRFSKAYTTCPVCIPARRSLMTGLHPSSHGMVGYADNRQWDSPPTLPQLLRDNGYHTGIVGRNMHLSPRRKRYGFEEMMISGGTFPDGDYEEFIGRNAPEGGGYYGSGVMHNDWTARPWHLDEPLHQTNWTTEQAIRFVRRSDPERPWFLVASYLAPHPPLNPPAFYFDRYLRQEMPEPVIGDWALCPDYQGVAPTVDSYQVNLTGEALRSAQAGYYGLINHVDDQIRRLFSFSNNMAGRNTVVVFVSDHGEMLGDHHLFRKSLPYESAARIPFILKLNPELKDVPRGAVCDLPVCLEDLMPTLLDVAGAEIPDGLDGRSLLPVLRGETPTEWRESLHIEIGQTATTFHSLTNGKEKYIWYSRDGREQFFDLEEDPTECHNLIDSPEKQEIIGVWRNRLIAKIADRPEGFVVDGKLKAGQRHSAIIPGFETEPC